MSGESGTPEPRRCPSCTAAVPVGTQIDVAREATDIHDHGDSRGHVEGFEYRIVAANGYHIWSVYSDANPERLREADLQNGSGAPHRYQRRTLGAWEETEGT